MIDKSVLIRDWGKFGVFFAERLAREFKRVSLTVPWQREFPKELDYRVGSGFDEFEKIEDVYDGLDKADLVCICDLYQASLQRHLRSLGKKVWGMGDAEYLERDRWKFKGWLAKNNMPMGRTQRVVGMDALRELLKKEKDRHIKIATFRGEGETWHHEDYNLSEPYLNEMEHNLGVWAKNQEFVVDDPVEPDGIEFGSDLWTIDGKYPSFVGWGFEIKDALHVEKICAYKDVPEQLKYVNDVLAPEFKKAGSRGFFATEVRLGKSKIPHFTDPTIRMPFPPIEGILESYTNLGECILAGASGEVVIPNPEFKYFAIARICSEFSIDKSYPIEFEEKDRRFIKLCDEMIDDKKHYVLPRRGDWEVVGSVLGVGETPDKAMQDCKDRSGRIRGLKISTTVDRLPEAIEEIRKAQDLCGIKF